MKRISGTVCCLLLCIAFFGVASAWGYYDDMHYSLTYYLARAAGYTPLQAYRLASACVSIDYSELTEPNQYARVVPNSQDAQSPRVEFHAFLDSRKFVNALSDPRQREEAMVGVLQRRERFWNTAKTSGNFGHFLHFLQDETSHFGYASWGGHWASYGAYQIYKPLGATCDSLSYGDREDHFEMINNTLQYMSAFMQETQLGTQDRPTQRPRILNRGREIIPVLAKLREVNPAPAPLGPGDILLIGASWALGGPLGGSAVAALDVSKAKKGPTMESADKVIRDALVSWGEIPSTWDDGIVTVFPEKPFTYEYDGGGHPRNAANDWTLYGNLTVSFPGPVRQGSIQLVIKAAKTRQGDAEEELARRTVSDSSQPVLFKMLPVGDLIVEAGLAGQPPATRKITLNKVENNATINLPVLATRRTVSPKVTIWSATVTPAEGKPGSYSLEVTYSVSDASSSEPVSVRKSTNVTGPEPVGFVDQFNEVSDSRRYTASFEHFFHSPGDYFWNYQFEVRGSPPASGRVPVRVTEMVYVLKEGYPLINRTKVAAKNESGSHAGVWELREETCTASSYLHHYRREDAGKPLSDLQFRYDYAFPVVIVPSKGFSISIAGKLAGQTGGNTLGDSTRVRLTYPTTMLEPEATGGDDLFLGDVSSGRILNTKKNLRLRFRTKDAPSLRIELLKNSLYDWPIATWDYELKWLPSQELSALLIRNPGAVGSGGGGLSAIGSATDAGAQNRTGNDLFRQKQWREAETAYREAIRLDQGRGVYHANLAGALLAQNRREEALAAAREALRLGYRDHPVFVDLGLAGSNSNPDAEKEMDLRERLRRNSADAEAHNSLGNLLYKQGKWRDAEVEYRAAVNLSYEDGTFHGNLAGSLLKQGRRDDAVSEAQTALGMGLRNHPVLKTLGLDDPVTPGENDLGRLGSAVKIAAESAALLDQKRWAEAEQKAREAVRLSPLPTHYALLAMALGRQDKWPEAEQAFRTALKEDPKRSAWHSNLGISLVEQKKLSGAESEFREAIRLDPQRGLYHANLARTLLLEGRREDAATEAREAVRLGEKNHPVFKALGITE